MKPFDLEKALAGEPVVTRSGLAVTEIQFFQDVSDGCGLVAVAGGVLRRYDAEGVQYYSSGGENPYDLFMAPVKKRGWVVVCSIHNSPHIAHLDGRVFSTKEGAQKAADNLRAAVAVAAIEWEE